MIGYSFYVTNIHRLRLSWDTKTKYILNKYGNYKN